VDGRNLSGELPTASHAAAGRGRSSLWAHVDVRARALAQAFVRLVAGIAIAIRGIPRARLLSRSVTIEVLRRVARARARAPGAGCAQGCSSRTRPEVFDVESGQGREHPRPGTGVDVAGPDSDQTSSARTGARFPPPIDLSALTEQVLRAVGTATLHTRPTRRDSSRVSVARPPLPRRRSRSPSSRRCVGATTTPSRRSAPASARPHSSPMSSRRSAQHEAATVVSSALHRLWPNHRGRRTTDTDLRPWRLGAWPACPPCPPRGVERAAAPPLPGWPNSVLARAVPASRTWPA